MNSRSQANTLAVDERQKVEALRREQKTLRDALVSVEDKLQQAERQKAKLTGEIDRLSDLDEDVSNSGSWSSRRSLKMFRQAPRSTSSTASGKGSRRSLTMPKLSAFESSECQISISESA